MEQKLYLQYLSRKRHFYKSKLSDLYIADLAHDHLLVRPPYLYHHQYTLARARAFENACDASTHLALLFLCKCCYRFWHHYHYHHQDSKSPNNRNSHSCSISVLSYIMTWWHRAYIDMDVGLKSCPNYLSFSLFCLRQRKRIQNYIFTQ